MRIEKGSSREERKAKHTCTGCAVLKENMVADKEVCGKNKVWERKER